MRFTDEQAAIVAHRFDAHALVRAVPGSGKTTTLVGRVVALYERGVDPRNIRVVMFNRSIEAFFRERLAARGVVGVRVNTFDSVGLEVLRVAQKKGLLQRRLEVVAEGTVVWAREIAQRYRDVIDDEDDLADSIAFWKAHLVTPRRAVFATNPGIVEAYAEFEELRTADGVLRVAFEDMVYTAVAVLNEYPRLLGLIDHLFVDEFQDVNLARVTLLQRLCHDKTSIVAVGDEDQAINEWCGARPQFFQDFSTHFPWIPTIEYPLSQSFRFGPGLGMAAARLISHNARGPLEIVGAGAMEGAIVEIADVLATLAAVIEEGIPKGEVAVLYRGRGQGLGLIALMANARIPLETEDFERMRASRAARLVLGYLRFATSNVGPSMQDAWRIVYAPDRFISKGRFEQQLNRCGSAGLAATLADRAIAREFGQSVSAIGTMADLAETLRLMGRSASAGEALEVLRARVNIEAQLTAMIKSRRKRELALLVFEAFCAFVAGLDVPLADAVDAVEAFDPTQGAPPDQRVWASTIHKAKGKEWRCVILPALAEGLCPAEMVGEVPGTVDEPDGVEQSPWIEQERRIFYVGLTRASDRVYIQTLSPPSRFLTELRLPPPRRQLPTNSGGRPSAHGRSWSAEEEQTLVAAWKRGADVATIAATLGRSVNAVAYCVVRLGLAASVEDSSLR